MDDSRDARIQAIAALDEPNRRRLYDYIAGCADPITRDEAADAVGLARATAAFHLDRLAAEGLLDVIYERRTRRSGPGAGRPSKLYCRADRHVEVSLPERRYLLAGTLLAAAIEDAVQSGRSPRTTLEQHAHRVGEGLGRQTLHRQESTGVDRAVAVLTDEGFEPELVGTAGGTEIVLRNCPFHTMAQEYTELVCSMNLALLTGVLDGVAAPDLQAELDPRPGYCCVRLAPTTAGAARK